MAEDGAVGNGYHIGAVVGYGGQSGAGAAQAGGKVPPGQPFLNGKTAKPVLVSGDGGVDGGAPGQGKFAGLPGAHDHFLAGRAETFADARPQLGKVVVAETHALKHMADDRAGADIGQPVHAAGQVSKVGPVDLPSGGYILPRLPLTHIPPLQAVLVAAEAAGGDGFPPGQG